MVLFELFSHNPTFVHVAAGKALFSAGDAGQRMYVLTTGCAELLVNGRVVEMLQHGSIVGEMGVISPGPRTAGVVARSDCEFVEIDEKRFRFLVQQTPYFAMQVMRVMAERLQRCNALIPAEDQGISG